MLATMFALLVAGVPPGASPTVSVSVAETSAGACASSVVSVPAAIEVTWTSPGFQADDYLFRLYEDDVLFHSGTDFSIEKEIDAVRNGPFAPHMSVHWVYRIDVVRRFDNAVVATASTSWSAVYGQCGHGVSE